jgi:hypothetical protein
MESMQAELGPERSYPDVATDLPPTIGVEMSSVRKHCGYWKGFWNLIAFSLGLR